jgi:hypothetical protein
MATGPKPILGRGSEGEPSGITADIGASIATEGAGRSGVNTVSASETVGSRIELADGDGGSSRVPGSGPSSAAGPPGPSPPIAGSLVQAHVHVQSHVHWRLVSAPALIEKVCSRPQKLKVHVQSHGSPVACDGSAPPVAPGLLVTVVGPFTDAIDEKPSSRASALSSLAPSNPQFQVQFQIHAQLSDAESPSSVEVEDATPSQSKTRYHSHVQESECGISSY